MRCWSIIHTGRMLQLSAAEQRSSSTGFVAQCRSKVSSSDAWMTSRTLISAAGGRAGSRPRAPRWLRTISARRRRRRICST
jgi:hypothetical protein